MVGRDSFDAWGKRRNPNGADDPNNTITSLNPRGFTFQEHLDNVGLVHMNGRVYDPLLGRFTSADPFVQFPDSTQGYNRYAYVFNNPLSLTDPTGYFSFDDFMEAAVVVFITWATDGMLTDLGAPGWLAAAGSGAVGGAITGGNLKSMVSGAITGGIFGWIGEMDIVRTSAMINVSARALAGGVAARIQGEKFESGFLAGGFGALAAPVTNNFGDFGGMVADSTIGGISSVLGGGKFVNGAVTAAFGRLFDSMSNTNLNAGAESTALTTGSGQGFVNPASTMLAVNVVPGGPCTDISGPSSCIGGGGGALGAESEALEGVLANRAAGKAAENFLNQNYGGEMGVGKSTSSGWRFIDNLTNDGVSMESKVGRTSLTNRIEQQIQKDYENLMTPGSGVNAVEWHFFPGKTGVGPTAPLQQRLQSCGIIVCIH